jgi:hypothetical protein
VLVVDSSPDWLSSNSLEPFQPSALAYRFCSALVKLGIS